jgi:predicted RNA-binding Zn-ribbon protein involved in translation (DUF1610 family)
MSFIDVKYIALVSSHLLRFEKKKEGLYNFRCPYCGDSQKRQDKARGYLFKVKNDFVYKCHNCGVGRTFTNFLKDQNSTLHEQYVMERYKEGLTGKNTQTKDPEFKFTKPVFIKSEQDINLQRISELNTEHPARVYLESRKIEDLTYFYYCPKFKEWTNQQKETFKDMRGDGPRIILPLYTADKKLFGFQGRSLSKTAKLRYITVILDENHPKVFGLDRVNTNETIFITEGPFDSMFLTNSIAMCGSDVNLGNSDYKLVYIFDNEPRNAQIVRRIETAIETQQRVVIWPSDILQKDINDMVLAGHDVQKVVESNIYQGLEAKLKLNTWKKV